MTPRRAWLLGSLVFLAVAPAAAQEPAERMTRGAAPDTHEDAQPRKLPALPRGMTLAMIRQGDSLFRGKGGCVTCHGQEASGMPALGSSLTGGLLFIPPRWGAIYSVIMTGIPEPMTRTPNKMPARGAKFDLRAGESRLIAAYVWAISQTRGEPWPGGHVTHGPDAARAAQLGGPDS